MKDVIPPAAAALDSLNISALCVNPGSLKWTWSSITPGIRSNPEASMILVSFGAFTSPGNPIASMSSFLISRSPLKVFPSFIIVEFLIKILDIF